MKILVLSDSHSAMRFMRSCVAAVKPNVLIHLGDHYDDGKSLHEENPGLRFYQVPGNCDFYRCPEGVHPILSLPVCGVNMYMTHGHLHGVKMTTAKLLKDARESGAQAVLYGHTHIPDCHQEPDGLWVLNPGTSGYNGGTAGLIEVENGKITRCRILYPESLEGFV